MAGLIPRPFLDELLHRTDLVELIDSYVPLKKRGNSYLACCPFHNEKSPSFNVVAKKQFYHCFGCGVSGNAISFVMAYLNQGFTDAVETLASRVGMTVPREGNPEKTQQTLSLYQLLGRVSQYYQQTLKRAGTEAIAYLRNRGLSGEIAKRFQIGYAPAGWHTLEQEFRPNKADLIATGMLIQKDDGKTYDRYRHRIMFPIHDRNGRIIGFGGRIIDPNDKPKYLNSPETIIFQKNRELYGLHQILQQNQNVRNILIVEGYLDVIALAQHGINNAVAALGTATSTYHIQLLSKHTRQVVFCFDGDEAGKKAAWRALENSLAMIDNDLDARFVFLPDGHDPDSLVRAEGTAAFLARIDAAIPLNQYLMETLSAGIDTQSAAGKSRLINAAKPLLQLMPDGACRQLLIDDLSRATRIENHRVTQLINDKTAAVVNETQKPISRSPIRLAVSLILQHPEIYQKCQEQIDIDELDGPGQETLQKILRQIAQNPGMNTASLIELWRETELFESLGKLAGWDHQVPDDALVNEFIDHIHFLKKQNIENKISEFLAKSRKQGLTNSEQLVLQDMIQKNKQQTARDKK
ncbi:DNA primase [Legionella sp. CNM-4043-24]|uniref:DNA primase n=1 Tax=Legionella sp. CNM-4043-24 TaxID=3421646 RepID=UPI00403A97CE